MNPVINLKKVRWCFNNNNKALCMDKLSHTFKVFIIIKTPSYLLKINKRTNKKYLRNSNFEMHFYHYIQIYERCY